MRTLDVGARVAGYRIESELGDGAVMRVYRARQEDLDRTVVLRVVRDAPDSEPAARLLGLARRLAALDDPHLVRVFEAGVADGVAYAAGADVGGARLTELLAAGPLAPEAATAIVAQLASAYDALESAEVDVPASSAADVVVVGQGRASHAYLDALAVHDRPEDGGSPVGGLARLLETMVASGPRPVPERLRTVVARAESYPSASAFADAAAAALAPERRISRRWAVAAAALAAAAVAALLLAVRDESRPRSAVAAPNAPAARLVATIPIGGTPGSMAVGQTAMWVATQEGNLLRVDPRSNRVIGAPVRFAPKDPENNVTVRAGGGMLFALDGNRGTIVRLDERSRRITGRLRLGGTLSGATVADGVLWVLRWERGRRRITDEVVRVDAATLRRVGHPVPIGRPLRVGPQASDVEAQRGVAWVTNSTDGTVMRLDSATNATTTVRIAALSVDSALLGETLWVPDVVGGALTPLDAQRMRLPAGALHPEYPASVAVSGDTVWVMAQSTSTGPGGPQRLYRIDPRSRTIVGQPVDVGSDVGWIAAGFGAVWVRSAPKRALMRFAPTSPAPAGRPQAHSDASLQPVAAGPLRRGEWATRTFAVPVRFTVDAPGWSAVQNSAANVELGRADAPLTRLTLSAPEQVFAHSGRVTRVRSPEQVLALIAANPDVRAGTPRHVTLGGVPATTLTLRARRLRRYPEFCASPCVALFGMPAGTLGVEVDVAMRLWLLRRAGRTVVVMAETDARRPDFAPISELLGTLRFG
jgi:DNA-binding beta-propeller fold protein YncE